MSLQSALIPNPLTVSPETPIREAIRLMHQGEGPSASPRPLTAGDGSADCVVVVADDGQVVGLLTERDVVRLCAQQQLSSGMSVGQAMAGPALTLSESALSDSTAALALLQQNRMRHLPIVDDQGQLVGLVTTESLQQSSQTDCVLELQQNSQRFKEAQRIAKVGSWELNLQTNALYWSEEVFRIFEVDPRQFEPSYTTFLNLVHPDDRAPLDEAYRRHLKDQEPYSLVHRLQMPDGRIKYVREQCETNYAEDGSPSLSHGTVQDITPQRETELLKEGLEVILQQVLEGTATVAGEQFFSNLVLALSKAVKVPYALISELVEGQLHSVAFCAEGELQAPIVYHPARTPCEKVLLEGEYHCSLGVQSLFPEDVDLLTMAAESYLGIALKNERGEVIGNLCILDKVPMRPEQYETARQIMQIFASRASAELQRKNLLTQLTQLNQDLEQQVSQRTQELMEKETKYRGLMTNSPNAIIIANADGYLVEANQQAEALLGYSLAELTTRHMSQMHPPEELPRAVALFADIAQQRCPRVCDVLIFQRRDGSTVSVEVTASVIEINGEKLVQGIFRDISQRLAMEQALRASEAKYRQIIETAQEGVWIIDAEAKHQFGNETLFTMLGRTAEEMAGRSLLDFFAPEWHPHIQELLARRQAGIAEVNEVPLLRGDGSVIWSLASATPLFDEAGQYIGAMALLADITPRKLAEATLQTENAFRRMILENLTEGLCVGYACPDYPFLQFTVWNPQMEVMTGYSQAEINELGWYQTLHPDPEMQVRAMARVTDIYQGEDIQSEAWTIRHRDGSDRILAITTSLLPGPEGQTNILAVIRDITQRKQAEQDRQALLQELGGFKRGLDEAAIVAITDFRGIITYVNPKFVEISGYSEAELIGQTHRLVKSGYHPPSFYQDLWETLGQGQIWRGEICNRAKNGHLYWVDSTIVPFLDAAGKPERYLAIRFEITEQKQAQQQLQQNNQLLEGITQAQSQFITAQNRLEIFEGLLSILLELSNSEYGFIGEVLFRDDGAAVMEESFLKIRGVPYLKTHGMTNIAWDEATQKLYEESYERGMEFTNMNTLFGAVIMTGQPVIANSPRTDPRRGGTPEGHPPLNAFLGLPFFSGDTLLGMVGVANRPGGYTPDLIETLKPLLVTCSNLIEGYRENRRRQAAELQLQASEQFLHTVLNTVPLSVFWKDRDSRYLGANARFLKDADLGSLAELIGKTDFDLPWGQTEAEGYQADDRTVMESGEAKLGIIETQHQTDGGEIWLETNKLPLRNLAGEIVGVLGTYKDITPLRETELKLRDTEERQRLILDFNHIGTWDWDFEQDLLHWNAQTFYLLGIDPDTIPTYPGFLQVVYPDDVASLEQALNAALINRTYYQHQFRVRQPSGELRWLQAKARGIYNGDQLLRVYGVVFDISDRKGAERIISQQAERELLLREISQRIRQSLDLQIIFETACQEICQALQADRVGIFRFYPEADYNDGEFVAESPITEWPSVLAVRVHDHCFGENFSSLYTQGRYYAADDIENNGLAPCHSAILTQFSVRANLVLPLQYGQRLWGLLCIHQCSAPRQWQEAEITLAQQLANQLSIAIQQASLYDQTQAELLERQRAETQLALQLRQQAALATVTQLIHQEALELSQILVTVTQQVRAALQGDRVIVFRLYSDGRSQIVEESVADGLPRLRDRHWQNEVWSQDILDCYWQGQPRIVPDVMDDIWTNCLVEYSLEGQIQSKMVAPILQEVDPLESHRWVASQTNQKLWGVLVIHACTEKRIWLESEAQILQQVANQVGIAIQQAHLFEQLQQELGERQRVQGQLLERNEQLAMTNTELARATRLKDEFLANMSHELRTPLNAILGMTEGLQEGIFGLINEKQLKALRTVESSANHLLSLINDILDVAKIESGQVSLDYNVTSIEQLCYSSLAFVKQQALKKQIRLETVLPPRLPAITVDEIRMRQVLLNLLTNAVKFTPQGGRVTLTVSVLPPDSETTPYLRLAITDTGIGIAPENIAKLFKPFVQIDSALNRKYTGTGLGLALVKQIVELHGGRVGLTSELGVGSCFTIDLPYQSTTSSITNSGNSDLENEAALSLLGTEELELARVPLILLAEDEPANVITISSYLEAKGYRLICANDGREALEQALAHSPDLVLMDVQMPEMDGLEAIRQMRQQDSLWDIPIIALTALAAEGDRERCLAAGADKYLSKPVRLKQLDSAIKALLGA